MVRPPTESPATHAETERELAERRLEWRRVPLAGDVLASERSARADFYDISIVAGERRMVVARYSDAIQIVHSLAQQLQVDGWFTTDQTHYAHLASHRARLVR